MKAICLGKDGKVHAKRGTGRNGVRYVHAWGLWVEMGLAWSCCIAWLGCANSLREFSRKREVARSYLLVQGAMPKF